MKFVVSRDLKDSRFFANLLLFFFAQGIVFQIIHVFYEKSKWGWAVLDIKNKILGNESLFIRPMLTEDFVVSLHTEIFLYLFLQTMVLLVFLRTDASEKKKTWACVLTFVFLLCNELSPLLIRYVSESFVFTKIISFWLLNASLLALAIYNISFLWGKKRA